MKTIIPSTGRFEKIVKNQQNECTQLRFLISDIRATLTKPRAFTGFCNLLHNKCKELDLTLEDALELFKINGFDEATCKKFEHLWEHPVPENSKDSKHPYTTPLTPTPAS